MHLTERIRFCFVKESFNSYSFLSRFPGVLWSWTTLTKSDSNFSFFLFLLFFLFNCFFLLLGNSEKSWSLHKRISLNEWVLELCMKQRFQIHMLVLEHLPLRNRFPVFLEIVVFSSAVFKVQVLSMNAIEPISIHLRLQLN